MFKKINVLLVVCLLLSASLFLVGCGGDDEEAEFPERPLELIVAFAPGGPTDVQARIIAQYWEEELGQNITIINREGAGGQIGITATSHAEPDGYTMGFLNVPLANMVSILAGTEESYDVRTDFDYIGCNVVDPNAIMVHRDSEFETLEDLLEYAKENPGDLLVTSNGPQADDYIAFLDIENEMGVEFSHLPQQGDAEACSAVMGNHADAAIANFSNWVPRQDDLRVLAVLNEERAAKFPDIPTFEEETGVPIYSGFSARGIVAPAGVPEDRLEVLRETFEATVTNPELIADLEEFGLGEEYWDAETFETNTLDLHEFCLENKQHLGLEQ